MGKPARKPPADFSAAARKKVEARIESHLAAAEALIAFLDLIDGDENLEPSLDCGHAGFCRHPALVDCEADYAGQPWP